ncbi:MAG: sulfatase-like hydrolase/transferase [Clostridia bacterium]|nr:sulfatase-like hydrolase/transferase [Clostridia bacterium]
MREAPKRPNFLMIVADQHRADMIGAAGKFPVETPNLDALCARGTRFENAFTPLPVCAPARQSMLCGLNPDSYGAYWNFGFFAAASLSPNDYWPSQLQKSGYRTAFFGKWAASQHHGATEFGYDSYTGFAEHSALIAEKFPEHKGHGWFGGKSDLPLEFSKTHWLAGKAAEQIRSYADADEPWHIRVDYTDPHLPCEVSEPFYSRYAEADLPEWGGFSDSLIGKPYIQKQQQLNWGLDGMTWEDWLPCVRNYYGMVSQIDDSIGLMLKALEESGQLDNTVIFYLADHGDTCGSRGMIDKHYILYDDVVKVPLIVCGPAIAQGAVADELVSIGLDLPPTVDALFGVTSPEAQGQSMMPLMRGEHPEDWRKEIVASSNGQQFGFFNQRMLRDHSYKYVWNLTDIDEFYDLTVDPDEKENRIHLPEYADRISAMRKRLAELLKEQGDPFAKSSWLNRQLYEDKKQ